MIVTALSIAATLLGRQMCSSTPMVLIPLQPSGLLDQLLRCVRDAVPAGVPGDTEPAGQRGDGGVVVSQRVNRPGDRPGRELGALRCEPVLLGPGLPSTRLLAA